MVAGIGIRYPDRKSALRNGISPLAKGLSRRLLFGVLVHEVSRVRRKAIDRVVKPLGITGGQWWVLTYISLHDGKSQGELAEDLNLGKVALGGLIDRLEKSGLLERRIDGSDRRMKRVHLTAEGLRVVEEIRKSSSEVQEAALAGISHDEVEHAIAVLKKMETNLQAIVDA